MVVLAPGSTVGHYLIDKLLGEGSMGKVFRAKDTRDDTDVALKVMTEEAARSKSAKRRFLREARAARAVDHPNVVRILEVFEEDAMPVIVMEFLAGKSFEDLIVERGGRVPIAELAHIMLRVTSAVGSAHALGIVHRDLKPLNVFITKGSTRDVRVLDFGIAKLRAVDGPAADTGALTETGAMMGTPYYMSPEQATGERTIDQRADIWAIGIMLYQCLTGALPTAGSSFGEVFRKVLLAEFEPLEKAAPDTPADLAGLIGRMLTADVDGRPNDLREVHEVLSRHADEAVEGETVQGFGEAAEPIAFHDDRESANGPMPAARGSDPGFGGTLRLAQQGLKPLSKVDPTDADAGAGPPEPETLVSDKALFKTDSVDRPPTSRLPWVLFALVGLAAVAGLAWSVLR